MKIGHELAEKKFVPGLGGRGLVGSGLVFSKFKDRFKPINNENWDYPKIWTSPSLQVAMWVGHLE